MKTSNTSCTFTFSCYFLSCYFFPVTFFPVTFFPYFFFPVTLFPTTRIPIPHVGRAKTDHRNILGVVIDVGEKGLYQVQTRHGVSNSWFCHNQFELCEQNILSLQDLPQESANVNLSVREAAIAESGSRTRFSKMQLQRKL